MNVGFQTKLAISVAFGCLSAGSWAQQPAPSVNPAEGEADAGGIADIVVTAQRRAERLQDVPIAISAISGADALARGVTDTESIQNNVPSLVIRRQANGATPFLRGVGTTYTQIGNEPSVATYIDGVYIGSPQASIFSFNNIERIEVLKGPQGTLFGRNATGGVINIITSGPTHETTARANVGYANYGTYEGAAYFSSGLAQSLAFSIAARGQKQTDGWGRNLTTGEEVYKGSDWGIHGKLLWDGNDRTTVTLAADITKMRTQQGLNFVILPGAVGLGGTVGRGNYSPLGGSVDQLRSKQYGASLTWKQDLDFASLVSISAYRGFEGGYLFDQDSTPLPVVNADVTQKTRTYTQELQLLSSDGSKLKWILGAYFFKDTAKLDPTIIIGRFFLYARQKTRSFAGYAQSSYEVLPDTNLTGGIRYTSDDRHVTGFRNSPTGVLLPNTSADDSETFNKLTFRVSLDHKFSRDVTGYVSFNRGFKSGVYNLSAPRDPAVRPEVLDAIEVGLKSEFLDRRVRANFAAFDYKYRDIQVQQINAGTVTSINAARAHIYGGELELQFVPSENIKISAGASYLHGRYTKFPGGPISVPNPATCSPTPRQTGVATGGNTLCPVDLSGRTTVRTPSFTGSAAIDWRFPTSIGNFNINANIYANGGFFWEPDNQLKENAYRLVNSSLQWTEPGERYYVRGWVKNLFNVYTSSYTQSSTVLNGASPGAPRTYGITVGYSL